MVCVAAQSVSDKTYKPTEPPSPFKYAWAKRDHGRMAEARGYFSDPGAACSRCPPHTRSNWTDRALGLNVSSTQVKDIL